MKQLTLFVATFLLSNTTYALPKSDCPQSIQVSKIETWDHGDEKFFRPSLNETAELIEGDEDRQRWSADTVAKVPFMFEIFYAGLLKMKFDEHRNARCHYTLDGIAIPMKWSHWGVLFGNIGSNPTPIKVYGRASLSGGGEQATLSVMTSFKPSYGVEQGPFSQAENGKNHYLSYKFEEQINLKDSEFEAQISGYSYMFWLKHKMKVETAKTRMTATWSYEQPDEEEPEGPQSCSQLQDYCIDKSIELDDAGTFMVCVEYYLEKDEFEGAYLDEDNQVICSRYD